MRKEEDVSMLLKKCLNSIHEKRCVMLKVQAYEYNVMTWGI